MHLRVTCAGSLKLAMGGIFTPDPTPRPAFIRSVGRDSLRYGHTTGVQREAGGSQQPEGLKVALWDSQGQLWSLQPPGRCWLTVQAVGEKADLHEQWPCAQNKAWYTVGAYETFIA